MEETDREEANATTTCPWIWISSAYYYRFLQFCIFLPSKHQFYRGFQFDCLHIQLLIGRSCISKCSIWFLSRFSLVDEEKLRVSVDLLNGFSYFLWVWSRTGNEQPETGDGERPHWGSQEKDCFPCHVLGGTFISHVM